MLGETIQIGDSFRDRAVETLKGMLRHIMFVIAESEDEVLVVPMDSVPKSESSTQSKNSQVITVLYPQAKEFPLAVNSYGYKRITAESFINYKKAQLYSYSF